MSDKSKANLLELSIALISQDSHDDWLGLAANAVLTELLKLQRGEFICRKCLLRKDGDPVPSDF